MWKCNINGDVNEESVMAQASDWKKAASALPGGEGMMYGLSTPSAVGADGDGTDVMMVVGVGVIFQQLRPMVGCLPLL